MDREDSLPHPRLKKYASETIDQLFSDLHLTKDGLNENRVRRMQRLFGINRADSTNGSSHYFLSRLRRAFVNPFSLILLALAALSFVTDVWLGANPSRNGASVLIILAALVLGGMLRLIQESHAVHTAETLTGELPDKVRVLRQGQQQKIPSTALAVGDLVLLSAGDRIPADLRLIRTQDLFVSQSLLTGESDILKKDTAVLPKATVHAASLRQLSNLAFAGSTVVSGAGKGVVLAVGNQTIYGDHLARLQKSKNTFNRGANAIAWVLIRFMAVLTPIVFVISGLTQNDGATALAFALSVAIGLTPELLPMVITACLAKGSAALNRRQTIVKNIGAMESFGAMDVLCIDKTGTLTGDEVILEYDLDILGRECPEVLDCAYLNSFYHRGDANHLDRAVLRCAAMPGQEAHFTALARTTKKLDELPFGERRMASVLIQDTKTDTAIMITKGEVNAVYRRCLYARCGDETTAVDPDDDAGVRAVVDELREDGMKVLAVAYKKISGRRQLHPDDESGLTLLGYLVFFDAPRSSASEAISQLAGLHVTVKVLTGDDAAIAGSVCRRLGISTQNMYTGAALNTLNASAFAAAVSEGSVFCSLTPGQKAQIIDSLKAQGQRVGFIGDGINDLAAMHAADTAISVNSAAPAVKKSADVILMKKDLRVLARGILEGRRSFANMTKYIRIAAAANFGNIFSVVLASAFLPFLPMTAAQLLTLNLTYDLLCLTLPWDRADTGILTAPSRWGAKTLGRFMGIFGSISSLFDLITFGFLYLVLCPAVFGGPYATLAPEIQGQFVVLFHSGWFLTSLWTQVASLHLLRTRETSPLKNPAAAPVWLTTSAGLAALTGLVYSPAAAPLGLAPLPAIYSLFLAAVIVLYLAAVTFTKRLYLKKYHRLS